MKYLVGILLLIWTAQISAYDELHMKRFKALNKCPGCDLSGANFSFYKLDNANLRGANLRGANFSNARVAIGAEGYGADFSGAILVGANFSDFWPEVSDFTDADLTESNLEEGHFERAIFCRTKTPWGIENIGCK